jgi:hypothetical protein
MNERKSLINQLWRDNRCLWFLPGVVVGFLIGLLIQLSDQPAGWFRVTIRTNVLYFANLLSFISDQQSLRKC